MPGVDEVRATQNLPTQHGTCTCVGAWLDEVGWADHIGGPEGYDRDARQTKQFRLPRSTSGMLPFFSTEHNFVWCLPPGPLLWELAMWKVRWTHYHAAMDAAAQGGSLRLLPPPTRFLISHALEVDGAYTLGGPALRRISPTYSWAGALIMETLTASRTSGGAVVGISKGTAQCLI